MDINYNTLLLVTAPLIEGEPASKHSVPLDWCHNERLNSGRNSIVWYGLNGTDQCSTDQEGNYQAKLHGTSWEDDQEKNRPHNSMLTLVLPSK